ncbi:MAG TPA: hypothetical protein VNG69_08600, partial [Casimicrobiaceae bacterium]|nr:hypothetical protein [Casimicrobiaceae bacterium]
RIFGDRIPIPTNFDHDCTTTPAPPIALGPNGPWQFNLTSCDIVGAPTCFCSPVISATLTENAAGDTITMDLTGDSLRRTLNKTGPSTYQVARNPRTTSSNAWYPTSTCPQSARGRWPPRWCCRLARSMAAGWEGFCRSARS